MAETRDYQLALVNRSTHFYNRPSISKNHISQVFLMHRIKTAYRTVTVGNAVSQASAPVASTYHRLPLHSPPSRRPKSQLFFCAHPVGVHLIWRKKRLSQIEFIIRQNKQSVQEHRHQQVQSSVVHQLRCNGAGRDLKVETRPAVRQSRLRVVMPKHHN